MAPTNDKSPWRNSTFIMPSNYTTPTKSPRGRPVSTWGARKVSTPADAPVILPPDRDIHEGLKEESLSTIDKPSATKSDEDIRIKDCQYIGSYSWTDRETPTIIVPGAPPQWQGRSAPYNVQPDRGIFFSDQNGYRCPKTPLLPLITAVNTRAEAAYQLEFDWSDVDFVLDRNALRKLVRWARGDNPRDFRLDLQLAGRKTVLVNRWEKRTREIFNGRTFGFGFEKASTLPVPDCREATGHHRIISYDLNGLKLVVRFEVDACIPPPRNYTRRSVATMDEITASLSGVVLDQAPSADGDKPKINIIKAGYEVSPSATMELSTRSEYKQHEYDFKELYPQLFFSQTTHHVLAIHNRGRFTAINRRKLGSPEFQELEDEMQPYFKVVRKALDAIRSLVVKHGEHGRISILCKNGQLKVYERISQDSCLPDHLMELFKET
ncbi:hypothetical protein FA15DRAFT_144931 [Coprinopsis marcescibilis]|uniref:Geranylgeranyl pyrophosphate synthetase n=1 Tax=Coprinopsis marcescibilis TaxID=230819 RepID=A0A5C3L3P8_COPMA|nr:hypothetical protein FA15DRAFT_144931 [Coprinopsis marcescibilis]